MTLLLTLLGAAVGAPTRWIVDQLVQARRDSVLPLGTLAINTSGSLLLGAIVSAGVRGMLGPDAIALAGGGFCGGFTTFSTFSYETVRLAQDGARRIAALNVLLSAGLGLVAVAIGWTLVAALP